jgi:tetratricopeptide (TPR) repeat protein
MSPEVPISLMTMQWLLELQVSPARAVSDALAGLADFGRYQRADPDDAIVTILRGLDDAKAYEESLARGIWDWLETRRGYSAAQREAYGFDAFIREVRDALIIAQRMDLVLITRNILSDFWSWENWTQKLQLHHPSRDARLQLLKLCAVHQQALQDGTLEPRWIQLCRDAGTTTSLAYLDVGLLGLRASPRVPGEDVARRVAFGLGIWAATYRPAKDDFLQRWINLRHLMPRTDPLWREIVEDAIADVCRYTSLKDPELVKEDEHVRVFHAADWWRETISRLKRRRPSHAIRTSFLSPLPEEGRDLIAVAREGFTDEVIERTIDLFERHEQWVRHYGNCYYYNRALTVIAPAFIKLRNPRATEIITYYLRRALMWDEHDPFLWNTWQRCLVRLGKFDDAENIAWETVRRFPRDIGTRVILAQRLAELGRSREAESLLREIGHLNSLNSAYYLVLGKIISANKNRRLEALQLISTAIEQIPGHHGLLVFAAALNLYANDHLAASTLLDKAEDAGDSPHYYAVRFRLAFRDQGEKEARSWLDLGLERHRNDPDLLKKRQLIRKNNSDDLVDPEDDPLNDFSSEVFFNSSSEVLDPDHGMQEQALNGSAPSPAQAKTHFHPAARPPVENIADAPADIPALPIAAKLAEPLVVTVPLGTTAPHPAVVKLDKKRAPKMDRALDEAIRHGRAKRLDFALNGAGIQGNQRKSAYDALEALANKNPEFLYGQMVYRRRARTPPDIELKGIAVPPAVQIEFALRNKNAMFLQRMTNAGTESLLANLGSALAGDKEACEKWKEGLPKVSTREGYASQVLSHLLADLGTHDMPAEKRSHFRMLWKVSMSNSELSHFFFQAIDASLLFGIADDSVRLGMASSILQRST